ncbi:hypothetical protein CKAN_02039500 [Cinnamomum micranthum f. kanehirae]|uniref:Uncharacterized protein n=1 Tax=Cinnamomum micranthum f. kanehirae TaxID=337451 RepID=A0A443PKE4_9MAGN|nr:hypothetical protein CKAN_02039500 [Cinnamomum micranthum f. kanehirae]
MNIVSFVTKQPGLVQILPTFFNCPHYSSLFVNSHPTFISRLYFSTSPTISVLMEFKFKAREDRASSYLAPFPTYARFPAEAIRASEFLLRKREVEVKVGRNLTYEREVELRRQAVRFSLQESTKHKAKGEASTSSSPTPKKPYNPTKPAKQVGQLNKSQNIVRNGESRADVKVRVVVKLKQDKNEVVVSSGTAVRALKANKCGGNNKVILASKGKPHGCVKKY